MKRISIVFLFAILSSSSIAQISGGVKAGLNLANAVIENLDSDIDKTMRPGLHFGVYANVGFGDKLSFQPEVLYNAAGVNREYEDVESGVTVSVEEENSFNYLSIPLMLKYSFGPVNLQVGPQFSFLLNAETESTAAASFAGQSISISTSDDIKDDLKSSDVAANLGLGLDLGKFNASIRYSLGLTNINDVEGDDDAIKNRIIQLSVGYKLFGN